MKPGPYIWWTTRRCSFCSDSEIIGVAFLLLFHVLSWRESLKNDAQCRCLLVYVKLRVCLCVFIVNRWDQGTLSELFLFPVRTHHDWAFCQNWHHHTDLSFLPLSCFLPTSVFGTCYIYSAKPTTLYPAPCLSQVKTFKRKKCPEMLMSGSIYLPIAVASLLECFLLKYLSLFLSLCCISEYECAKQALS